MLLHYHTIITEPTIRQPGFNLSHYTLSLLNHFWTGQVPCLANLYRRSLSKSAVCECWTTNHIVLTYPLTKSEDGQKTLHDVDNYDIPYILAYKPTIFGLTTKTKLCGSACMRVMPYSHTLAARVSAAWTISRPLGRRVAVEVCAAGSGTTHKLLLPRLHTS